MRNEYEMVTLTAYVELLDNTTVTSIEEKEIEAQVEKYLLNQKRYETNAKIVEALLA